MIENKKLTWLAKRLLSNETTQIQKLRLIEIAKKNPEATIQQLQEYSSRKAADLAPDTNTSRIVHYGNIWVRSIPYPTAGFMYAGHTHPFNHLTHLTRGSLQVQVKGYEPAVFHAPAWIIIPKEHEHEFIALEDNTHADCIHAVRDLGGDAVEIYDTSNVASLTPLKNDAENNKQLLQE